MAAAPVLDPAVVDAPLVDQDQTRRRLLWTAIATSLVLACGVDRNLGLL
jgi:hypothetical protein